MQIHELTFKTLDEAVYSGPAVKSQPGAGPSTLGSAVKSAASALGQGVKNVGSAVASTASDIGNVAKGGKEVFQQAGQERKINQMATKAYDAWINYAAQLEKSIDPADKQAFDSRTDGYYEKQLLAFVNKNLLGGMYLPNVANKDQILGLVKKLSAPKIAPPAGGAGAFGQMAGQLSAGPAVGTQKTTSTGGKTTTTPTGVVHTAKTAPVQPAPAVRPTYGTAPSAQAPVSIKGATKAGAPTPAEQAKLQQKIAAASKKTMNEALDAATEKELFTKLVRAAALAQPVAPGASQSATTPQASSPTQPRTTNDARTMAQSIRQQFDDTTNQTLRTAGATAGKLTGDVQVTSTGNPVADGLLILMGFQGL